MYICRMASAIILICLSGIASAQTQTTHVFGDTSRQSTAHAPEATPQPSKGEWGFDFLMSTDGFGVGGFYRRELTPDIAGFVSLSVSESKDPREIDQIDPFTGVTYTPGKLNRFLVFPLMTGIQYRLFREDITDSFRPYVNVGIGPSMIYVMPYADVSRDTSGALQVNQVDFFAAIGRGHPRFTGGGYVGVGANFGPETGSVMGFNIRYYFMYLLSGSIPSLFNTTDGSLVSTKRDFGGFFITLNIGFGG